MASEQSQQIRFISPTGSVGGGISGAALDEALAQTPHFIACDAGTTDAGPFSLGMGITAFPREAVKHDLAVILRAGRKANIPVIIGSAGTARRCSGRLGARHRPRDCCRTPSDFAGSRNLCGTEQGLPQEAARQNRTLPLDPALPISDSIIDRLTVPDGAAMLLSPE
jgi:hypothetical protein